MYINDYSICFNRDPEQGTIGAVRGHAGICGTVPGERVRLTSYPSDVPLWCIMSLWTRFLDWLLGVNVISMDNLKAIEDSTIETLRNAFAKMNEDIDVNADGNVSIREAWTMIKTVISIVKAAIKGLINNVR